MRLLQMQNKKNKTENIKMNRKIDFTEYAPIDREYTKRELAEIYKKIIKDIEDNKR
jgi:hypothetical protein